MDSGSVTFGWTIRGTGLAYTPAGASGSARRRLADGSSLSIGYGTSPGLGNLVSALAITIGAGANTTINLYDGSVLDVFGQPAAYRQLRLFAAWVSSGGDSAGVTISPGASSGNSLNWIGTSPGALIYPAGPPLVAGGPTGVTVDNTHKTIKFLNNGAVSVTVSVDLAGSDT